MRLFCFLLSFLSSFIYSRAQCNGSFGAPVFFEDFGLATNGSNYAGPLGGQASTTYTYLANPNLQDGQYTIASNPIFARPEFFNTPDATIDPAGQNGNMLIVNADFNPGEFYRRRVSGLCNNGNSLYRFSAKVLNVLPSSLCQSNSIPINVRFQVFDTNGNLLGALNTGNIQSTNNPIWRNFSFDFQLPSGVSQLDLVLTNNGPGGCGNDLAIDDISFQICGDTLEIDTSVDVENGANCQPSNLELVANIGSNQISNPNFNWEISNNNGSAWQNLACNTANCNVNSSQYSNGDLIRYSVISAGQTNSGCRLFSDPITINLANFNPSTPPNLVRYSQTNSAVFNLEEVVNYYSQEFAPNAVDISFFENETNLQNNNPIINIANYQSGNRSILVRIQPQSSNCQRVFPFDLIVLPPLEYDVCDVDSDGIHTINFSALSNFINQNYNSPNNDSSTIYFALRSAGIAQLANPESTQEYSIICPNLPNVSSFFELAVNNQSELFLATGNEELYKIDVANCNTELIANLPSGYGIAMSFDTENNLYVGDFSSRVLVAKQSNGYQNYGLWHDFGTGHPAGDFIEINNKLYISWNLSNGEFLYEVILDENKNYVSHTNVGQILTDSFGMAGEFGVLYGVTRTQVYRIDLNPFNTQVIFSNPSAATANHWFGAAGRHEAVVIQLYPTPTDAQNQTNPITTDFTNQTAFMDFVFLRIDNPALSTPTIIPIQLNITPKPEIPNIQDIVVCNNAVVINTQLTSNDFEFEWLRNGNAITGETSPEITISQAGNYQLILTALQSGCQFVYDFTAIGNQSEIIRHFVVDNQIELFANNALSNSFSLDGINYQGALFSNVAYQVYNASILDQNNCQGNNYPVEAVGVNSLSFCDENIDFSDLENQIKNFYTLDVSNYNLSIYNNLNHAINQISPIRSDFTAATQSYFYRLEDSTSQSVYIQMVNISIFSKPVFGLNNNYTFCAEDPNSFATISANGSLSDNYMYEWFYNGSPLPNQNQAALNTRDSGEYKLLVTNPNNGCSYEQTTTVIGSQVQITNVEINNNTVTVFATGSDGLEFSSDGVQWQSSNQFVLDNGTYQLFARNQNACISNAFVVDIFLIANTITPNQDGVNDVWVINSIENYPNAELKIYDRYGKLIYNQAGNKITPWDASYLGTPLPSGTYWYNLYINPQQQFTGFITVKRK